MLPSMISMGMTPYGGLGMGTGYAAYGMQMGMAYANMGMSYANMAMSMINPVMGMMSPGMGRF
jgi:hypothetical protein